MLSARSHVKNQINKHEFVLTDIFKKCDGDII